MDRLLELTYRAEQSHFWFRGFRQYMKPALERATAGVTAPRILDCGCGTGSNLEMLRPFGNAVGFDLTRIGTEFARAHGHRVAQASISDIPFRSGTFDLATSFDVFQTLPDAVERAAIGELFRVLKPGGYLLLHVAALDVLHGKHSVLSEETRRYTPAKLRALVESGRDRAKGIALVKAAYAALRADPRTTEETAELDAWMRARGISLR